jgi:hypothetical protein
LHPSSGAQLQRTAIGFVWFGVLFHWSRYWLGQPHTFSAVNFRPETCTAKNKEEKRMHKKYIYLYLELNIYVTNMYGTTNIKHPVCTIFSTVTHGIPNIVHRLTHATDFDRSYHKDCAVDLLYLQSLLCAGYFLFLPGAVDSFVCEQGGRGGRAYSYLILVPERY